MISSSNGSQTRLYKNSELMKAPRHATGPFNPSIWAGRPGWRCGSCGTRVNPDSRRIVVTPIVTAERHSKSVANNTWSATRLPSMIRFTSGTLVTAALANYALGKARSEAQPAGRPQANLHIDRSPPAREQRIAIMATSCATPVTSPAAALAISTNHVLDTVTADADSLVRHE